MFLQKKNILSFYIFKEYSDLNIYYYVWKYYKLHFRTSSYSKEILINKGYDKVTYGILIA